MSNVHFCPHCGSILPPSEKGTLVLLTPDALPLTVETPIPGTACGDEANSPSHADHRLSSIEPERSRQVPGSPEYQTLNGKTSDDPDVVWVGSEEFDTLAHPPVDPYLEALAESAFPPVGASNSDEASSLGQKLNVELDTKFPLLQDLSTGSPEDLPTQRSWTTLVLASYASAVTIALVYMLWTSSRAGKLFVDTMPRPTRSGSSSLLGTPQALSTNLITEIGRALVVGHLEVTPTQISMETIELDHLGVDGETRREQAGKGLVLRLDLKNLSATESFSPLEREFVRNTDSGSAETVITGEGKLIPAYPLASTSELEIVGQSFEIVGPGASIEARVVSNLKPDLSGVDYWTWRVKLRVSATETRLVGIRFSSSAIP